MLTNLMWAGIGFVTCAFTPAIGRQIKAWFVATFTALKSKV
jgi:hypothetical protein